METLTGLFAKQASEDEEPIGEPSYEEDEGYNRDMWDRWHPRLNPVIHRHLALDLPSDHPAHDAKRPMEERAQAILDHVSETGNGYRKGLGYHWTDDPGYNHLSTGNGRVMPDQTRVVLHAKTPPREHIEDNDWVLEDRAVRDWDMDPEREVPLKRNAPVHITGVTWQSGRDSLHHDFGEPIVRRATIAPEEPRVQEEQHTETPLVHRGLSVVLSPEKHAFVHNPEQPLPARAHLLLSEVKKQKPNITSEDLHGGTGGLGEFWSPIESKAHEFAHQSGWQAYHDHMLAHGCGEEWSGDNGCPTTTVVLHAHEPSEKHHWKDIFRDGEEYHREFSWRLPVKPGTHMKVTGISWHPGEDHLSFTDQARRREERGSWDLPLEHYDFNAPVKKRADYTHKHKWLPNGRYWGPNSPQNDQRLFEGDHLRPEVREDILKRVGTFFKRNGYRGWHQWTRVYFAGSEAAKWAPFNGDFDVLIGINWPVFRLLNPEHAKQNDLQVSTEMTDGLWNSANVDDYYFTLQDGQRVGPFSRTFFVNPLAWDITKLHPYAAYDVTDDSWAVHPMKVPDDWSAEKLPESYWGYAEAVAKEVRAIGKLPPEERARMARNLWEEIHTHRSDAFADGGKGLFDLSNVIEKYLDQHPQKLWDKLREWKRGIPGPVSSPKESNLTSIFQQAATRTVTDASGADHYGVMVALVPPTRICEALAVEKGEPVEQMHITLAYLGGKDDHEADHLAMLPDYVEAWARTQKPLTAKVGGVGTFVNPTQHVLWAAVDIPHGTVFRDSLVSFLEGRGYSIRHDHGWTPHITLQYGTSHFRFMPKVEPMEWECDEVWVCTGGNWRSYPLGGRS